jgi:hypothetical protein
MRTGGIHNKTAHSRLASPKSDGELQTLRSGTRGNALNAPVLLCAGPAVTDGWAVPTRDELTGLYRNGPDDESIMLALSYVTTATSGC